jgi:hypothetical protein
VKSGFLLTVLMTLAAAPVLGDEVYLKGGGQLTGEIVGHTEDTVTVDIGAGTMTVQLSTVVRIEEGASALEQYRAKAATLAADDVEAWRELGRQMTKEGLNTQAREAWSKVLAVAPEDPEANRALGRVQLDGRWVTEAESYQARGFVEFEGEWMMPDERQAILEHRKQREEADRQALQAQIQADDAAAREREAQEAAQRGSYGTSDLPQLGEPVAPYWGYGGGPAYWPANPGVNVNRPFRSTPPSSGRRR